MDLEISGSPAVASGTSGEADSRVLGCLLSISGKFSEGYRGERGQHKQGGMQIIHSWKMPVPGSSSIFSTSVSHMEV